MAINTPLLCRKCDHVTSVDMMIFRQRKAAGLPFTCAHCGEDLVKHGSKPPKKGATESQKQSRAQEKRMASKEGARLQPGSGNVTGYEGDIHKRNELRGEAKTTIKGSYSLKVQDLIDLERESRGDELPVFEIEFRRANQTRRYVVLPEWAYDALMEESGRRTT